VIARRPRPIVSVGAVLLSLLAAPAREARAAPLSVRLDYVAGPGCPDADDFKAVVMARLGYDPFVAGAPEQVLVRITPRDRAIDGRIEWRDSHGQWAGEQTFPSVSTDCSHLVRAMGFALAVQIQLLAKATAAPRATTPAPTETASPPENPPDTVAKQPLAPTPSKEPPVASVASVGPATTSGPPPALAIGAGPAVGFGMSSGPVLLGRMYGVIAWQHVAIELAAVASLPATTRRADGAGFSQQHLLGSAAACATTTRWNGCVVGNAGEVRMAGENIDRPTSASLPVIQVGARAGVIQRLGRRAFLNAHADGLINLTRWTGSLDQVPLWTAPRFAATLGLEAGLRLP
jgi:hypothetical protein